MAAAATSAARGSGKARWRRLVRRLGLLCVRYHVKITCDPRALGPLCYVLENDRTLDRLVLEDLSIRRGWPVPRRTSPRSGALPTLWSLRMPKGRLPRRWAAADDDSLHRLIVQLRADPHEDIRLVPVAIFLGRAPTAEHSWIKLLFAEDWAAAGRFRRFFAMLFYGRDTLVKVGDPVSLAASAGGENDARRAADGTLRQLREYFDRQRAATIGPDVSHRRLLLEEVLATPQVRDAMRREAAASHRSPARVRARARRYAKEIAAHYSYPVIRVLDRLFTWVWNRLYDGVDAMNTDGLDGFASGSELVYVPCHRSHIDYILLLYVIYRRGLTLPHTAAGINLNIPLIGPILRAGGAFFIRRTFKGDALYAAVVRGYFRAILSRGFPAAYFVEGTRSRTGRLQSPKLGLLLMTVESFLSDRTRPVVFIPVYFGYEKLLEGETFIGELRGKAKRQESLGGFVRALKTLRERFGTVQVNFGEPIRLEPVLDDLHSTWRDEPPETGFRPPWVGPAAADIGVRIMTAINEAAVINAVNLTALVVLSMPKQAIVETELKAQLALYLDLLKRAPYASRTAVSRQSPEEMIGHCEEMKWLIRQPNPLGDILRMDERRAVLASYYRNNILHLFALPSLIAVSLTNAPEVSTSTLEAQLSRIYPCLKTDLFLRWRPPRLAQAIRGVSAAMAASGLLREGPDSIARPDEGSRHAAQFELCAEIVQPFLERYYLSVAALLEEGPGAVTRAELQSRCAQTAEQLSIVYRFDSPDLFDPVLFENLVDSLMGQGTVWLDTAGRLAYGQELRRLADSLAVVLRPGVRQTLRHLAGISEPSP